MRQHTFSILFVLCCLGFGTVNAQEAVTCPGAPPPRLTVGEQGQMAPGPANNLRTEPSTGGDYMGQLEPGDIFEVLAGPVCADGYAWWLVNKDGLIGWSAEGVNRDYWLEPYLAAESTLTPAPTPFITPTASVSTSMEAVFSDAPYYYDLTLEPNEQVIALLSSPVSGMPPYLYVMNPHGGNVRIIAMEDVGNPVWSPNGQQLLWRGRESFYVWDVNAGVTYGTSLGDPISGDYGWLPDSTEIFFTSADRNTGFLDILVMPVEAGGIDNLTNHRSNDRQASWSPDGQTMVFLSDRSGNAELYRVDRDRHNLTQLTSSGFNNWPVWSPDGSRIAWIEGQKLMTMSPDGSNITTWVDDDVANFRPVWSPDGTKMVYVGLTDVGLSGIHILDMNSGATVAVPANYSDDTHASWSPDGTQLVFQVYDGVYRVNADGTGLTKIAQPIDWVAWTAWRPGLD